MYQTVSCTFSHQRCLRSRPQVSGEEESQECANWTRAKIGLSHLLVVTSILHSYVFGVYRASTSRPICMDGRLIDAMQSSIFVVEVPSSEMGNLARTFVLAMFDAR